jgi:SdrD B-like domain/Right handed beta helix region
MYKKYEHRLTHWHFLQKVGMPELQIRGAIAKKLGGLAMVAASLCWFATPAQAEGSAQVGLNQRLYEYGFSLNPLIPLRNRELYVDVSAGEVINVSACGSGGLADPVKIEIYNPAGFLVTTQNIAANANVPGRVSCTDPFTAALTNPFRYVATTSGAYSVRLYNQRTAADLPNDYTGSLLRRFDITVTPNITTNPDPTLRQGRVYAKSWAFRASTNDFSVTGATDGDYFIKVPGGLPSTNYVWKLDLNQFAGLTYEVNANSIGVNAPNNGFSTALSGNSFAELYPVYLSYPQNVSPEPANPPLISNVSFVDNAGIDNTISPSVTPGVQDAGFFKFTTDVVGSYAIIIDTNKDGLYKTGDVFLFGSTTAGINSVAWNGRDAKGNILAVGTYNAQVQVRTGEYHFVSGDAETSGGGSSNGLTIYRALSQLSTLDTNVYWDDVTKLPGAGGTANLPNGGLSSSPQGKHTWGNFTATGFGDQRFIDTYTYGATSVAIVPAIISIDDIAKYVISGTVYNDANFNGTNNTETGIGSVKVALYNDANSDGIPDGPAISTQTTNASGQYAFPAVANGNYLVQEIDATSWISTTTNSLKVVVANAAKPNQDFGDYQQTANFCPSTAFLHFSQNSGNTTLGLANNSLYSLDLTTGTKTIISGALGLPPTMTVLAFNKLDGFLYGLDGTTLYRINQTGVAVSLGSVTGLSGTLNGGAMDGNGYLYVGRIGITAINVIDLNPARSTFKTVVGTFNTQTTQYTSTNQLDMAVSPVDGYLYFRDYNLYTYRVLIPTNFTGTVTATEYFPAGGSAAYSFGALFITPSGLLYSYGLNNASSGSGTQEQLTIHNTQIRPGTFITVLNSQVNPASLFGTQLSSPVDGASCSFAPAPPVPLQISGTVFEDVNYGGGAGRNETTPGAVGRSGARVELYTDLGAFVAATTTGTGGSYSFTVPAGGYQVRVVNSTVSSSRPGGTTSGLVPVQTYQTNVASGIVTPDLNRVGGVVPGKIDAAPNTGTQTLSQVLAATPGSAIQSIASVTGVTATTGATNINFGFNFDTIVNTNDLGQGSFRQFILNSNALGNTGLAQANITAGTEASIFMISDGAAHPGLRVDATNVPNLLTGGVAKILVKTALPSITDSFTLIDGSTQTVNIGNSNTTILGSAAEVGLNGNISPKFSGPEVEIRPDSTIANGTIGTGLQVEGNSTTITQIAIDGFGAGTSSRIQAFESGNIRIGNSAAVSNTTITQNIIGTSATGFGDIGTNRGLGSGIVLNAGSGTIANTLIQNNLIGYHAYGGIVSNGLGTPAGGTATGLLSDLSILTNEIVGNGLSNNNSYLAAIDLSRSTIGTWTNILIEKNLLTNNVEQAIQTAGATNLTIQNNTIGSNGTGGSATDRDGLLIGSSTNSLVYSNQIINNKAAGISVLTQGALNATGIKITQNEFGGNTKNAIDLGANGVSTNTNGCTAVNSGGANGNLARPVITSTGTGSGTLILSGTYCNTGGTYDIEFYRAGATGTANGTTNDDYGVDSKPAGEGLLYLGKLSGVSGGVFTDQVISTVAPVSATDTITAIAINTTTRNTSEFSENAGFSPAKVLFVKRITAINDVPITTTADDTSLLYGADDDNPKWPAGYLKGAINVDNLRSGDRIQYTIYFLNAGGSNADSVRMCDVLKPNQTFLPAGTNTHDIEMVIGTGTTQILTQANDTDRGQLLPANDPLPSSCHFLTENTNGTAIVDITGTGSPTLPTLVNAKVAGTANSYGLIRFTTTVNP